MANRLEAINHKTTKNNEEEEIISNENLRDWSSLTDPLLLSILKLLTTLEDFFAFHGVCRNWRSLSFPTPYSTSSQSPLILLTRSPCYTKAFYDITQNRVCKTVLPWNLDSRRTFGYSHGHLITATRRPNQKLLLWNLFTGNKIRLPKAPIHFDRVILSSSPSSSDCLVLLWDFSGSVLQYCRFRDRRWCLHYWSPLVIKDAIFFEGRLYVLTSTGRLGMVNIFPQPELVLLGDETKASVDMNTPACQWFLAESGGKLLLVCIRYGTAWLKGFELWHWDFERGGGLVKESNLGGRALFMWYAGFAGSVATSGLGVRKNSIYYIFRCSDEWLVYSLDDGTMDVVSPAAPGLVRGWVKEIPVWIFPSLC